MWWSNLCGFKFGNGVNICVEMNDGDMHPFTIKKYSMRPQISQYKPIFTRYWMIDPNSKCDDPIYVVCSQFTLAEIFTSKYVIFYIFYKQQKSFFHFDHRQLIFQVLTPSPLNSALLNWLTYTLTKVFHDIYTSNI